MSAISTAVGDRKSWRRRIKQFAGHHLRQLPCLHAIVSNVRCWKRKRYQTLGDDEEDSAVEDQSQQVNMIFGQVVIKAAMFFMIGTTILLMVTGANEPRQQEPDEKESPATYDADDFKRDSPIILYLATVEILICGACAHTAATMFQRRYHALKHPAESSEREKRCYIQVQLEKEAGLEDRQLYGIGFHPSSDGLECLVIETIRPGSLLDRWNRRALAPSPEQLVEEALGLDGDGEANGGDTEAPPPTPATWPVVRQVYPGAAVAAVNDVTADVGMMQLQLTQPKVTLWIRPEMLHPSQLEVEMLAEAPTLNGTGGAPEQGSTPGTELPAGQSALPPPTCIGLPASLEDSSAGPPGPRFACVGFEDEELQIINRWMVCSVVVGWVTLLPVLLLQPHHERPRQQLFRQYLLKPCLLMLPVWILMWTVDCVEILIGVEILRPFYYFAVCHMVFPVVLVWYLMQMQAADERLVLDQRRARETRVPGVVPVVVEDPCPVLLKEFIAVNPIALVFVGACAAAPIVIFSLLTPLETARGKQCQSHLVLMYGPLTFLQIAAAYFMYMVHLVDLPKLYLASIGLLFSLPCFAIWCCCLACASHHGRADQTLVQKQRQERAKQALLSMPSGLSGGPAAGEESPGDAAGPELVDCTEAQQREYEFIYSA